MATNSTQSQNDIPGVPPPPPEVKVRTMKSDIESMQKSGGGLPQFQNITVEGLAMTRAIPHITPATQPQSSSPRVGHAPNTSQAPRTSQTPGASPSASPTPIANTSHSVTEPVSIGSSTASSSPAPAPTSISAPAMPAMTAASTPSITSPPSTPSESSPAKSSRNIVGIVLVIVVAILAIVAVWYFAYKELGSNTSALQGHSVQSVQTSS